MLVEKLTRNYGEGEAATKVLRGVDFRIEYGEFVIIFGPSGSGKSTLLNILSGLEDVTSGRVMVDGQDISKLDLEERARFHREKIGMVFQAYNLIPSLTILQNITLPHVFSKIPKSVREQKAMKLLTDFKMQHLAKRLPSEVSGGQAQRTGIMRALIIDPPIIIADEPTGNLDSVATKNVMEVFSELNHKLKNTIIVVTHDPSLFTYADRIIHILDGNIIKETVRKKDHMDLPKKHIETDFEKICKSEKDPKRIRIQDILVMILSHHQLSSFHEHELVMIIDLLSARLEKKITETELYHKLDKPVKEGGVGLYAPTAKHIAEHFESILLVIK